MNFRNTSADELDELVERVGTLPYEILNSAVLRLSRR
jgi:hypothetical protein